MFYFFNVFFKVFPLSLLVKSALFLVRLLFFIAAVFGQRELNVVGESGKRPFAAFFAFSR